MKKPRITILFDSDAPLPKSPDFSKQLAESDEAEFDVARTLQKLEYPVDLVGFHDDSQQLLADLIRVAPELVFNLTESFRRNSHLDYSVAALLEMLGIPYTGCPPFALQLTRDKAVSKKILAFHGVRVPNFAVYPFGQKKQRPSDLRFPLIVKPLMEDASLGIAQASVVHEDRTLEERVAFIHDSLRNDAIVEELIFGREIYVSMLGNHPPQVLAPVEMVFNKEENEELKIATFRAKWSAKYRKNKGIRNVLAKDLPDPVRGRIQQTCLAAYDSLELRDYGRVDVRLTPDGEVYVLEANPNPFIAKDEDLPTAAEGVGIDYPALIENIVKYAAERRPKTAKTNGQ